MHFILSIAPSPYENSSNASFKFAIKAPGDEHNIILSGDAKFKGAEGLQDDLKRTLLSLSLGVTIFTPRIGEGEGLLARKQ